MKRFYNDTIDEMKSKQTQFAIEDPGLKKESSKSLFIWRSNLISSSAKGQRILYEAFTWHKIRVISYKMKMKSQKKLRGVKKQQVS